MRHCIIQRASFPSTWSGARPSALRSNPPVTRPVNSRYLNSRRVAQANKDEESTPANPQATARSDQFLIFGTATFLATAATLGITVFREPILDLLFDATMSEDGQLLTGGDIFGGVLWSASLYYCSPLQLLLLFLGEIDTERPSDWVLRQLGVLTGEPVDAVDYKVPTALQGLTVAFFVLAGFSMSLLFKYGLGDATWSVSSGIGTCFAAAVYEVGRPQRLSSEQAQDLEAQWQDFESFASARLLRSGRCHESEVFKDFRRRFAQYRTQEGISDEVLRDMVRNFHPNVDRSPNGFYRNLSVKPTVDPFTQEIK